MNKIVMTCLVSVFFASQLSFVAADQAEVQTDEKQRFIEKHKHKQRMREYKLKRADTNGDGKIDLNEYLTSAEQRFKTMDLDSDGYVTMEERSEASKMMREKHREMRKEIRAQRRAERGVERATDNSD